MARLVSGVAVLALQMAIAVAVLPCSAGCASSSSRAPVVDRHVVPNGLVQVSLVDFEIVSFIDIDLHTAVQTREAVESEFNTAYGKTGHPRWFFHAFDQTNLDFVVARFEPKDSLRPRYVAERRLRVKRTREAERALGVTAVVREYEIGTRGVKAGMSRRDVIKVAGRAESEKQLGPQGAFDMRYVAFCVRFVDSKVAHIWRREQCTP
jgi:hypothetical protein